MTDTPTGQERPARLSEADEAWVRRRTATILTNGAQTWRLDYVTRDLLNELDATRHERDAWKARAEWLHESRNWIEAAAAWMTNALDIAESRRIPSEDMRADGQAILKGLDEALAEPQPSCPGYAPTGRVCERCGEAPEEHSRAHGLDGEGAE